MSGHEHPVADAQADRSADGGGYRELAVASDRVIAVLAIGDRQHARRGRLDPDRVPAVQPSEPSTARSARHIVEDAVADEFNR